MRNPIFSFLMQLIGAFIVWALKGFKGKFNDEMSGPHEIGIKSWRNFFISVVFLLIAFSVISKIIEKKNENISDNKYKIMLVK